MVSLTMGTADSGELAPEAPQPTHINVHIHQESALAKLLLTWCSALQPSATQPRGSNRLLVASWVVQIVLGIFSWVLGGFLYLCTYSIVVGSGAAIWTGAAAVLAGTVSFICEKRGGICWALLRILLALLAFSTAIAAIVFGANSLYDGFYYDYDSCRLSSSGDWYTPLPSTVSPEEARRLHLCNSYLDMLMALTISLTIMLMGIWILMLLASLVPLWLYCWRRFLTEEKTDQKKLLGVSEIEPCLS
ncbi:transmembrane protein 176A [Carlito syrichta]|uniref:Transmembrane protein 176A n=1 Tax=Carlito syrichta TaxID=1868482 RepID=A0A1U7U5T4_CARSF|nr:transmembrane protein 176A [Carlito syrichta]